MDECPIECPICLTAKPQEEMVVLHGSHTFHAACVKPWLLQKGSCPLCRSNDSVCAIIVAADPWVACIMDGYIRVSAYTEEYAEVKGWVACTPAEKDRMFGCIKYIHNKIPMYLSPGTRPHVYTLYEDDDVDRTAMLQEGFEMMDPLRDAVSAIMAFPVVHAQPPYGDFYVE
jgi:hypothetical protein